MDLFKAKRVARKEFQDALEETGLAADEAALRLARSGGDGALAYPKREGLAGTGARLLAEMRG